MTHPSSTGQVALYLGVPEPRLNDLIRRWKILPAPPLVAGRRRWSEQHVAQAAQLMGIPLPRALGEDR